jgi:hypothetical protein
MFFVSHSVVSMVTIVAVVAMATLAGVIPDQ